MQGRLEEWQSVLLSAALSEPNFVEMLRGSREWLRAPAAAKERASSTKIKFSRICGKSILQSLCDHPGSGIGAPTRETPDFVSLTRSSLIPSERLSSRLRSSSNIRPIPGINFTSCTDRSLTSCSAPAKKAPLAGISKLSPWSRFSTRARDTLALYGSFTTLATEKHLPGQAKRLEFTFIDPDEIYDQGGRSIAVEEAR